MHRTLRTELFADREWSVPTKGDGNPGGAASQQIIENHLLVDAAALVAHIFDPSERELEGSVAENEMRETFVDHGERVTKGDKKCGGSGLSAFALVRLAVAAVKTAVAVEAADVRRAGGTRVAELAGCGHGELIFAIHRNVSWT